MRTDFQINFIRHGPKDLQNAHITGSEALLTMEADEEIKRWTQKHLKMIGTFNEVKIISSPVTRSIQTGEIIAQYLGANDINQIARSINPQFSSYDLKDDEVLNLNPKEMSQLWSDAKDATNQTQKEDRSLYSWSEVGFTRKWSPASMSQEDIATRIFNAMYSLIKDIKDKNTYVLIIGHSGDIEPFLYYTLSLHEEANREDMSYMTQKFFETGGALSPLEGISFHQKENEIILTYPGADKNSKQEIVTKLFN